MNESFKNGSVIMQEIDRSEFCLDVHFIYADQVSVADQNNNLSNSAQCLVICRVNESIQAPNYNLFHNTCAQVWNTVTFIANKRTSPNLAHRQKNISSLLKTSILCLDVMSQFNVFDDSMDISIKLLIVW